MPKVTSVCLVFTADKRCCLREQCQLLVAKRRHRRHIGARRRYADMRHAMVSLWRLVPATNRSLIPDDIDVTIYNVGVTVNVVLTSCKLSQ